MRVREKLNSFQSKLLQAVILAAVVCLLWVGVSLMCVQNLHARQKKIAYPVLLDPGSKVKKLYSVEGIPMSFVYGRKGKLVAEAIDMRTRQQFLTMLADAGLK